MQLVNSSSVSAEFAIQFRLRPELMTDAIPAGIFQSLNSFRSIALCFRNKKWLKTQKQIKLYWLAYFQVSVTIKCVM